MLRLVPVQLCVLAHRLWLPSLLSVHLVPEWGYHSGAQHLQLALNGPSEESHLKLKMNLNPYLTLYFKVNSKWITVSNVENKTTKL